MKREVKFINIIPCFTDFPIFAFSSSAYAESLMDVPINGILYGVEKSKNDNALNFSGFRKDADVNEV
jgi:hypothetical protein